jgi:SAM-dependent methyltransferase
MNKREMQLLNNFDKTLPDCSELPIAYLFKSIYIKMRRRLWSKYIDNDSRFLWTVSAVSDADGPTANVRNYLEQKNIREILIDVTRLHRIERACEIGCGYGRVIMVLKEFANYVKGFERESHLVEIARTLNPEIEFECVESLTSISHDETYDFVMTCTVLQHLTDSAASKVCEIMKQLAPHGYILCIEKTYPFNIVTSHMNNESHFISRDRQIEIYQKLMHPYKLCEVRNRILEPNYSNPHPGKCMLFASPTVNDIVP